MTEMIEKYPHISRAFTLIALDNGGIGPWRPVEAQQSDANLFLNRASESEETLTAIDQFLGKLIEKEFEVVCCGEQGQMLLILDTEHAPPGVNDLLDRYFEEVC